MKFILTGIAASPMVAASSRARKVYYGDDDGDDDDVFLDPGCVVPGYQFPPPPSPLCAPMTAIPEDHVSANGQLAVSRNSVGSRDSRGSLTHYGYTSTAGAANVTQTQAHPQALLPQQQHRLSGQSYESYNGGGGQRASSSTRQSINSTSSCCSSSLGGSAERLLDGGGESSGYSSGSINVADLFLQGLSDVEVLHTWLSELHFEGYIDSFLDAGYDMATISRMTPEDLTAIGITKPAHRRKLKAEISRLNIGDGIPDCRPASVDEWLRMLRLEQYSSALANEHYNTIEQLVEMIWEDLEDSGIKKLGHQKKMMLAIEKLKRVCKRQSTSSQSSFSGAETLAASASLAAISRWSADMACHDSLSKAQYHRPQNQSHQQLLARVAQPDVVVIQVKTAMSRSSSGNSINSSGDYAQPRCQSFTGGEKNGGDVALLSSEDSGSSGGSISRSGRGPLRAVHGMSMTKRSSQDFDDRHQWAGDSSLLEGVSQYATLRRSGSRSSRQTSMLGYDLASTVSATPAKFNAVCVPTACATRVPPHSPDVGSLPSPFSNFKSPYAHIQSGQVRNTIVSSASAHGCLEQGSVPGTSDPAPRPVAASHTAKKPPPPPKRSNSLSSKLSYEGEREKWEDEGAGSHKDKERSAAENGLAGTSPGAEHGMDSSAFPPLPPPMAFDIQHMKAHRPQKLQSMTLSSSVTGMGPPRSPSLRCHPGEQRGAVAALSRLLGEEALVQPSSSSVAAVGSDNNDTLSAAAPALRGGYEAAAVQPAPVLLSPVAESSLAVRRRAVSLAAVSDGPPTGSLLCNDDRLESAKSSRSQGASVRSSGEAVSLPFANENIGTIKQKTMLVADPLPSSCSSNTVVHRQCPLPNSSLTSDIGSDCFSVNGDGCEDVVPATRRAFRPVGHVQPVVCGNETVKLPSAPQALVSVPTTALEDFRGSTELCSEKPSTDVIDDIGCMLESLSNELSDAMLELEAEQK